MDKATRIARMSEDRDESYFWISRRDLLVLRPAEERRSLWDRAPFILVSQFLHTFRGYRIDSASGEETPLSAFNAKYGKHLVATPMHMRYLGADGKEDAPREIKYTPPDCALSPDGKWLLWQTRTGKWIAATIDGEKEICWNCSPGTVNRSEWLPSSHRWIELVSKYNGSEYYVPRILVHRLNDPSILKEISVSDMSDGLHIGITSRNTLLTRHEDFT